LSFSFGYHKDHRRRWTMKRNLAVSCSALMFWVLVSGVVPVEAATKDTIKEKVVSIPMGSVVAVKLTDKSKITGRLGKVDDLGFELQSVQEGRVLDERVPFERVRSIRATQNGMSSGAKVGMGVLAGVGVVFLIGIISCFASGACLGG
jgi:hypothetical protein